MIKNVGTPTSAPVIQPKPIGVKTPAGVGIGKKPHDRPKTPMTGVTG